MNAPSRRAELEEFAKLLNEAVLRKERKKQSKRGGLIEFVRYFWHILEPKTPLVEGWALYAICQHLEAVTFGEITRLLINVPPGFMKSLLTDVFWPAWEWSAMDMAHLRIVAFSYAAGLTERDNGKFRDLLMSAQFVELWGHKFKLKKIGEVKVTNDKTGSKLATSVGGIGTGERGDRIVVDDPHNVKDGESEAVRTSTVTWFRESLSNRLNNMESSAIVVIMQRVHEGDVSGTIITEEFDDYCKLMIPMEFDAQRAWETSIGWKDPRTEDGELAWPERFPANVVASLKLTVGLYAYAGQYQQSPVPRGGSILKSEYWQLWEGEKYPPFDFVLASADTAFTKKEINDPTGFTIWGVFRDERERPRVMLIWAWAKRCELHGKILEKRPDETKKAFDRRSMPTWGLVEWIAYSCRRFKVDVLLIENKASGIDVYNEMLRLYREDGWSVRQTNPTQDKVARAQAVEPSFAAGLVYAPDEDWAEKVILECVVAGTKIITNLGVKNVEDIGVGDFVLTHKGRFRPVLSTSVRETEETITLEPKCLDPITLTRDHPFYALDVTCERSVVSMGWVNAKDMKAREYRPTKRNGKDFLEAHPSRCHAATLPIVRPDVETSEIDLREWILLSRGKDMELLENNETFRTAHWRSQEIKWRQPLDYKFGRFLGLYIAEGSSSRFAAQFSFNKKERAFVDEIREFANTRLGCSSSEQTTGSCTIVSVSAPLIERFFSDCGKHAHNKRIPHWVWDAPDEFLRGVLDGYIDGDGHETRGVIAGTTVSLSLAWGIRLIALRLGYYATVRVLRPAGETTFPHGGTYKTKETYTVGWRSDRKNNGAVTLHENVAGYSIMMKSDGPKNVSVYNMHVFEDESYCTTGGIVHNCELLPKGAHDDLADSTTGAIKWLRDQGLIAHNFEVAAELREALQFKPEARPLYDA